MCSCREINWEYVKDKPQFSTNLDIVHWDGLPHMPVVLDNPTQRLGDVFLDEIQVGILRFLQKNRGENVTIGMELGAGRWKNTRKLAK